MNFYKIMLLQINFGSSKTQLKFHCGAQKENTGIKAFVFSPPGLNGHTTYEPLNTSRSDSHLKIKFLWWICLTKYYARN